MFGFTGNYVKVEAPYDKSLVGKIQRITLTSLSDNGNLNVKMR